MYRSAYIFVLLTAITLLSACSSIDPATQIPSYIHIDKINLNTTYSTEGTSSSKITDAWVYVGDQYIGTFELPATVPVPKVGLNNVSIGAGIKINGISANRGAYAFYAPYVQNQTLKRGEKINLTPAVNYLPSLTFSWKEDFETIGISMIEGTGSDTVIQKAGPPNAYEGNSCGVVYLPGNYFEGVSSSSFALPNNGDDVFLELNYKTNNAFTVGLYASSSSVPIPALTIKPSAQWNKIYVNLSTVTQLVPSPLYAVFISMSRDAAISQAELYLDNIKLIHR